MFPSQSMGYDRQLTVFSPEGRLYQVEYATEAVRHGPLAVGIKAVDGVVIAGEKRLPQALIDLSSLKKVLIIDDHIGTAIAGLHSDARRLINYARVLSQYNRLDYDEDILVKTLVVQICDIKQEVTQGSQRFGYRPFGASLLMGGVDSKGPQLFTTDPSGSFWGWKATAIGKESDDVREFFKENYKDSMNLEEAIKLALEGIYRTSDAATDLDSSERAKRVEIGLIDTTDKRFRILSDAEVEEKLPNA